MLKTKLAHAIAATLAGSAFSLAMISDASAAATVSYNTFNHDRPAPNTLVSGANGTDGWLVTGTFDQFSVVPDACKVAGSSCGNGKNFGNVLIPQLGSSYAAPVPWVGNDPRTNPNFNYAGTQVLHWTVELGAGEGATVSRLDSNARYGGTALSDGTTFNFADIDTAQGAWHDGAKEGWKHDTDIGLFRSAVTQNVHLSIASLLGNGEVDLTPDYGFTVFEGMDTTTTNFSHHGVWHGATHPASAALVGNNDLQLTDPNPFNISGLEVLILDDVLGNDANFVAEAGKVYTIMLGGFQGGGWTFTRNDYQLTITTSAVPVPGAVWLFGSALAGFVGVQRRKRQPA